MPVKLLLFIAFRGQQKQPMSLDQRREQEKQERRDSILDAAEKVFSSKGFDKCSMDEIARTAQLSRALLYVYFKDKAAIMSGIMLRSAACLRDRFLRAAEPAQSGLEQIASIGRAYYAFSLEEPYYFNVLTQASTLSPQVDSDAQMEALQVCGTEVMALMIAALQRGVADGSLSAERVADPVQTAFFLRGALHGIIMETRQPENRQLDMPEADTLITYSIDMFGHAMRA